MLSIKGVNVASGVTNASLVIVGVAGYTTGSIFIGASVTKTAAEVGVDVGKAPTTVGLGYCPHNDDEDALPTQELSNKESATNRAGSRFTVNRCRNYTCIDALNS